MAIMDNRPAWALRLERVRTANGMSQADLARNLNVSAMTLSRWERGLNRPSAEYLIELGKLFGPPEGWYFVELAGLRRKLLQRWINCPSG